MKQITLLFLLFSVCMAKAQELHNHFYYYKGEQVPLTIDRSSVLITSLTPINLSMIFGQYGYTIDSLHGGIDSDEQDSAQYWHVIKINNATLNLIQYNALINNLRQNDDLGVEPVIADDSATIPLSPYFYILLKSAVDTTKLDSLAAATGAILLGEVPYMPLWYKLKANASSMGNSLQLSNLFYETEVFEDIDPGFAFDFGLACSGVTDNEFSQQWGMENTNNPNLDINACDAWGITKGDPSIIVAVVDQGINCLHTELDANMYPLHYDALTNTVANIPPSSYPGYVLYGSHGNEVAGVIGAEQNGNKVSGIAPNTKLMSVGHSINFTTTTCAQEMSQAISWAAQNGASIINNSWGDLNVSVLYQNLAKSNLLEKAIVHAINNGRNGLGCLVVFAAGNKGHTLTKSVYYPGRSIPEILVVGNMGVTGQRWHESSHGSELDIIAPGTNIRTASGSGVPNITDITSSVTGTSFAAPHASGVAALMLAVNPCLTEEELRLIIESTAQKVGGYTYSQDYYHPNGTWNYEMGYGLLDAHAAVLKAQQMHQAGQDLYIKDTPLDFGTQPNTNTKTWISEDIWVRAQPDRVRHHQNPIYNPANPKAYIHVMVRNRGCSPSAGGELALYWAKASTGVSWQKPWTNPPGQNAPGPDMGGVVGIINLPVIEGGHDSVFIFEWTIPNPADYPAIPGYETRHFCFLARIYDPFNDPFYASETTNLYNNIGNNNNIASKNISVMKFIPVAEGSFELDDNAMVGIGNFLTNVATDVDLEFSVPDEEMNAAITDEAEVRIILDDNTWEKWQAGGAQGIGFIIINEADHILQATDTYMRLDSLHYDTSEHSLVAVQVNFLTEESTEKRVFNYDLIQKNHLDGTIIGGERFTAYKPERADEQMFLAGSNTSTSQQQVTLQAQSIGEPARYNWYKAADSTLVDTGTCITVTPTQNTTYLLEVVAKSDGFKDYSDPVNAIAPPQSYITGLSPNPATGQVALDYHLGQNVQSAQATITAINNPNISATYTLNISQAQATLSLNNLPVGTYVVNLYCDNILVDNKQLIIQ